MNTLQYSCIVVWHVMVGPGTGFRLPQDPTVPLISVPQDQEGAPARAVAVCSRAASLLHLSVTLPLTLLLIYCCCAAVCAGWRSPGPRNALFWLPYRAGLPVPAAAAGLAGEWRAD